MQETTDNGSGVIASAVAVLPQEQDQYRDFAYHYLRRLGRPLPDFIWHYTDANGLIGIIEDGTLHFSHVACLNDRQEQAYLTDLVHAAVSKRLADNVDDVLDPMLKFAEIELSKNDFSAYGSFVACFSESEDDLSQWRGYGGGECGYAIGFRTTELFEAVKLARPEAMLLPMNYSKTDHEVFVADVLKWAETFYRQGIDRGITDRERWADVMLRAFGRELEIFSNLLKHPSFAGEGERRIALGFKAPDLQTMIFKQKRTLLSRVLSIKVATEGPATKLPIANVWVGPGPAQQVSRIGVGDLLAKHGYSGIPVKLSSIPYRIP